MGNETRAIDTVIKHIKFSIHTFAPARVVSFDENKQEADIELLFMAVDSQGRTSKHPLIPAVPVLGMRYKVSSYTASITGLYDEDGAVNGSRATIQPTQTIVHTPFLEKDDIVFVAFSERAIDNLQGRPFDPGFRRMFDTRDAVVIGGYQL